MSHNNDLMVTERRQKIWILLTRGMKSYEIARELGVNPSTISRDINFITKQSQKFLDDLAKESLPFLYEKSLGGIQEVVKEAWSIYNSSKNDMHKLTALKIIKEANVDSFRLLLEGPAVSQLTVLETKLSALEKQQQQSSSSATQHIMQQEEQRQQPSTTNPITV
jgi:IS30 family transposase